MLDWAEVEGEVSEDSDDEEEENEEVLEKLHEEAEEILGDELSDSDDAGEWITPDNVEKHLNGYNPNNEKSK